MALCGAPPFEAWRRSVPDLVIECIARYEMPQYTWPLLHLAGVLGQSRFLESTAWCPAYPVLVMHHLALGLTSNTALAISAEEFVARVVRVPVSVLSKLVPHSADWRTVEFLDERWGGLAKIIQRTLRVVPRITRDTVRCIVDLPAQCVTPQLLKATEGSQLFEIFDSVCLALRFSGGDWRWGNVDDYETLLALPHRLNVNLRGEAFDEPPLPRGG